MSVKFKILNALLLGISQISPTEIQAQVCKGIRTVPAALLGNITATKKGNNESIHRQRMVKNDGTLLCSHFISVKSREQTIGQMERKKKVRVVFFS